MRAQGKVTKSLFFLARVHTCSMNVTVNSKSHQTNAAHLHDLLMEQGLLDKKGTAVALNGEVIPKSNWSEQELQENDQILIITATQGG